MIRIDEQHTTAPPERAFLVAADVERWPDILPHYRRVRFRDQRGFGRGVVEMAAWRDFGGPLRWPTWWLSEMEADADTPIVRYRHVDGITRGMDVRWEFHGRPDGTLVRIVHEWDGPAWPVIRRIAADAVIGPHFVSAIATRTLAGICAEAERPVHGDTTDTSDAADTTDDARATAPSPSTTEPTPTDRETQRNG